MNRKFRIAALLLLIFVGGGFVGWMSNRAVSPPARVAGRRPLMMTPEAVLKEMDAVLHFTPEQRDRVRGSVMEWRRKARSIEANSLKQRQELFQQMIPMIRTNLTAEQQRALDAEVTLIERRFQRAIRNMSSATP